MKSLVILALVGATLPNFGQTQKDSAADVIISTPTPIAKSGEEIRVNVKVIQLQ